MGFEKLKNIKKLNLIQLKEKRTNFDIYIDSDGKLLVYSKDGIRTNPYEYDIIEYFQKGIARTKNGDFIGMIREENGNSVIENLLDIDDIKGEEIRGYIYSQFHGYVKVKDSNGKVGVINLSSGEYIIPPIYDNFSDLKVRFSNHNSPLGEVNSKEVTILHFNGNGYVPIKFVPTITSYLTK